MEEIHDLSKYSWIEEQLEKITEHPKEDHIRVWHAIPKGFSAYCKILPPVYLDLDYADDLRTYADMDREKDDEEMEVLGNREAFPEANFKAQRMFWKELTNLQGVSFTPQISVYDLFSYSWPIRYVNSGREGDLSTEVESQLSKLLSRHAKSKDYFVSYIDYEDIDNIHQRIYKSNLSSGLARISTRLLLPGTQIYWWGINRDWCLAVDFDIDFSFFGGSTELVGLLIKDDFIECIPVEIDSEL
ncbi:MAG: hypothetical protein JNM55_05305 [Anaerolineales bacterium]|nr:hypothetical protein [Anaerolineales bacterium]